MTAPGEPAPTVETGPSAAFFDGRTSKKHLVALTFGATLEIVENDALLASWRYDDVRRLDETGGLLRLTAANGPELARLEIRDSELAREVLARCPFLGERGGHRATSAKSIVAWSLAAAASIVGMIWFGIPYAADILAPLVPTSWESRLGNAADKQLRSIIGGKTCDGAKGVEALGELSARLQSVATLRIPARIEVVSSKTPNALALPGGKVYVFSALLAKAEGPDEIAGVLAHELGHVHNRDHLRRLIANGGTSYLAGLLFGDVTGASALIFSGRVLLSAAHSRDAEARADAFAAEALERLGRPARPMGVLLTRIDDGASKNFGLLQDHPLTRERLAAFARADKGATGPALLTPAEWSALKSICD